MPVAIFLGIWELVARLDILPGHFFLPPFSTVVAEFYYLSASGVLGENFLSSLVRVLIGFCAGSVAGIVVGTIMGWRSAIDKALNPIISLFYPIPTLGWIPLLMLWIGINEMLPITLIFICSFFPVLYNTVTGIRNVDKDYIKAARTLGADLPILGRTSILNYFIASGHFRNGILLAPITAKLMMELIVLGKSSLSLESFRFDRFE